MFNPAQFRAGVRAAMAIGTPTPAATFHFAERRASIEPADSEGVPFDIDAIVATDEPTTAVTAPCALEYHETAEADTRIGPIAGAVLVVTLLDEDYATVRGFHHVLLGGTGGVRYLYDHTEKPEFLGGVGVYRVHCRAEVMP